MCRRNRIVLLVALTTLSMHAASAEAQERSLQEMIETRIKAWRVHETDVNFPATAKKIAELYKTTKPEPVSPIPPIAPISLAAETDPAAVEAHRRATEEARKQAEEKEAHAIDAYQANVLNAQLTLIPSGDPGNVARTHWIGFLKDLDVIYDRATDGQYGYTKDFSNSLLKNAPSPSSHLEIPGEIEGAFLPDSILQQAAKLQSHQDLMIDIGAALDAVAAKELNAQAGRARFQGPVQSSPGGNGRRTRGSCLLRLLAL